MSNRKVSHIGLPLWNISGDFSLVFEMGIRLWQAIMSFLVGNAIPGSHPRPALSGSAGKRPAWK